VRVRLDLGYDGRDFAGWARQPGRRTVAQVLEEALGRALRLPVPPVTTVAGRTDAGVHAVGQVAHVDVPADSWAALPDPVRRLARALPDDVRVRAATCVTEDFDARFSALWRRYEYRVADGPAGPDPLARHTVLAYRRPLDVDAMNAATTALLGEHDFAAFCRRREGASTVRTLLDLRWHREGDELAVAEVRADAFCHSMVRALVGAMLAVGDGRRAVSWPGEVLAARRRDPAVTVVPAHGLVLAEVGYPAPDRLAARQHETRRFRGDPTV
jgi:tRNA pseudouridine38-40 synthase